MWMTHIVCVLWLTDPSVIPSNSCLLVSMLGICVIPSPWGRTWGLLLSNRICGKGNGMSPLDYVVVCTYIYISILLAHTSRFSCWAWGSEQPCWGSSQGKELWAASRTWGWPPAHNLDELRSRLFPIQATSWEWACLTPWLQPCETLNRGLN